MMRSTRLVLTGLALALAAACTSNGPTAPSAEDSAVVQAGKIGSGQAQAPTTGASFGKIGSGQ